LLNAFIRWILVGNCYILFVKIVFLTFSSVQNTAMGCGESSWAVSYVSIIHPNIILNIIGIFVKISRLLP
jgi:hypothetical protein